MSQDKLKYQVKQQFLSHNKLKLSCDTTFTEVTIYHDWKASRSFNRRMFSLTACEALRPVAQFLLYSFSSGILLNTYRTAVSPTLDLLCHGRFQCWTKRS